MGNIWFSVSANEDAITVGKHYSDRFVREMEVAVASDTVVPKRKLVGGDKEVFGFKKTKIQIRLLIVNFQFFGFLSYLLF